MNTLSVTTIDTTCRNETNIINNDQTLDTGLLANVDFKKITDNSLEIIAPYILNCKERTVDYTLGGIFMWIEYFNYEYAIHNNYLYLRGIIPETGQLFYHIPLHCDGHSNIKPLVDKNIRPFESQTQNAKVLMYSEIDLPISSLENINTSVFDNYRYGKEYLYHIEQFDGFKGKRMEKKRNHLNKFNKSYEGYSVEIISDKMAEDLIDFNLEFIKNTQIDEIGLFEIEMSNYVISNYEKFGFFGMVIKYENKIIGYTIGEQVGDTFFIHIEKGNHAYDGIYQVLASSFCKLIIEKYPCIRYLNREEDMGEPNLIKSKESYHPCKYILKNYFDLE